MIFTHSGTALLGPKKSILPRLAVINSRIYLGLLNLVMPRGSDGNQGMKYELGYIRKVAMPIQTKDEDVSAELQGIALSSIAEARLRMIHRETTNFFVHPFAGNIAESFKKLTSAILEHETENLE